MMISCHDLKGMEFSLVPAQNQVKRIETAENYSHIFSSSTLADITGWTE